MWLSLLICCTREAFHYHKVPEDLRRLVANYLKEHTVMYDDEDEISRRRLMSCHVP